MGTCNRYDNLMWLSYARGRLDSSVTAEMESHAESCNDCRRWLDFFRKIAAIIDLNSAAPPESWIEEAAAKFEFTRPGPEPSNIFGNLVFDSYLHEKEAVRSRRMESRHLIFDLPRFEIGIAMEYSGRHLNMMVGHLLSKAADSMATLQGFSVELRVEARLYSTKPNSFGEFSFTVDAQITGEPLELRCMLEEGPCLIVLIPC